MGSTVRLQAVLMYNNHFSVVSFFHPVHNIVDAGDDGVGSSPGARQFWTDPLFALRVVQ